MLTRSTLKLSPKSALISYWSWLDARGFDCRSILIFRGLMGILDVEN